MDGGTVDRILKHSKNVHAIYFCVTMRMCESSVIPQEGEWIYVRRGHWERKKRMSEAARKINKRWKGITVGIEKTEEYK